MAKTKNAGYTFLTCILISFVALIYGCNKRNIDMKNDGKGKTEIFGIHDDEITSLIGKKFGALLESYQIDTTKFIFVDEPPGILTQLVLILRERCYVRFFIDRNKSKAGINIEQNWKLGDITNEYIKKIIIDCDENNRVFE